MLDDGQGVHEEVRDEKQDEAHDDEEIRERRPGRGKISHFFSKAIKHKTPSINQPNPTHPNQTQPNPPRGPKGTRKGKSSTPTITKIRKTIKKKAAKVKVQTNLIQQYLTQLPLPNPNPKHSTQPNLTQPNRTQPNMSNMSSMSNVHNEPTNAERDEQTTGGHPGYGQPTVSRLIINDDSTSTLMMMCECIYNIESDKQPLCNIVRKTLKFKEISNHHNTINQNDDDDDEIKMMMNQVRIKMKIPNKTELKLKKIKDRISNLQGDAKEVSASSTSSPSADDCDDYFYNTGNSKGERDLNSPMSHKTHQPPSPARSDPAIGKEDVKINFVNLGTLPKGEQIEIVSVRSSKKRKRYKRTLSEGNQTCVRGGSSEPGACVNNRSEGQDNTNFILRPPIRKARRRGRQPIIGL